MFRELMPLEAGPDDPGRTLLVMQFELGSITQGVVKSQVTIDPNSQKARLADARLGAADLLAQLHVLAEQFGWKWLELENDGMERFAQRMVEIAEGTI